MKMVLRAACCVCLCLLGCGSEPAYVGPARYALSGKVTLDGAPLDGGTISFIPQSKGNPAGGPIAKGEYSVAPDNGANAGSYRVEVRWLRPTGEKYKDDDTGQMIDVVKEAIPPKYNESSELKAEISAEKKSFDFELNSK